MKKFNILFYVLGAIVIIATILIGLTFASTFYDLRWPFILLGIALGIIILAMGHIIALLSNNNSHSDTDKKE